MKRYLLLLPVIALGIFLFRPTDKPIEPVVATESVLEQKPASKPNPSEIDKYQLWKSVNDYRTTQGRQNLRLDPALEVTAFEKCQDMAINSYWSHISPKGIDYSDIFDNHGYKYLKAGENLAYGYRSVDGILNGWKLSETHNSNMLDYAFTDVGYAVCFADKVNNITDQLIIVQHLAQ